MKDIFLTETDLGEETYLFNGLTNHLLGQIRRRLKDIRVLLDLSVEAVAEVTRLDSHDIRSLEDPSVIPALDILIPLLAFYGFNFSEFFNFSKALPSAQTLKSKMVRFHERYGTDAHKIVYNRPKLINFIENTLLDGELFMNWVTEKDVYEYCKETYNYRFLRKSIPNTLDLAVEKGYLIRNPDASPKRYKKNV